MPLSDPSPNIAGEETRALLIQAATEVFLHEGFRAARVKDIAELAGVRLSAINYHFGGKEGLYLAVLQFHAALAMQHSPLPSLAAGEVPEVRFRLFVRAMVMRMLDPTSPSRIASLMVREAANPTPALDIMFERFTKPQSAHLISLLREVMGEGVPHETLVRTALSIVAQSMVYVGMRPLVQKMQPGFYDRSDSLDALADHIATFSWAGVLALAARGDEHETS
ncbi:MAG: CerR family C-terminal domain-containing protein [Burkholderiales bacterium]|nr:CerR family C-terminal domain-containing protein [Burkholderiales bacterium]